MKRVKISRWEGCYDKQLKGFIVNEAFAHPAKYSLGLIERIFDYCLERGYLKRGDVVGDCFGGVAIGGLVAAYRGLRWVGVELEPKFVVLCQQNIALHKSKLEALGRPLPLILQGDSRKFHEHVQATGIVSSPPYADSVNSENNGIDWSKTNRPDRLPGASNKRRNDTMVTGDFKYGAQPGQIGRLKAGEVEAVISSPPFSSPGMQPITGHGGSCSRGGQGVRSELKALGHSPETNSVHQRSAGNIEALKQGDVSAVISSPPYSDIAAGAGGLNTKPATKPGQQAGRSAQAASQDTDQKYGHTDGQISRLKGGSVEAVVSSPPWEKNTDGVMKASKFKDPAAFAEQARKTGHGASLKAKLKAMAADENRDNYGDSPGQIGKEKGETYWQAMAQVYASCYFAIKPGGVIVLVVKDYVKGGKRVPLCDDTCRLLEHLGFTVIERIHAMLVKETRETNLDGSETVTTKSRKSFFRRMAEKKGSPKIDFEEVLIAKKPNL